MVADVTAPATSATPRRYVVHWDLPRSLWLVLLFASSLCARVEPATTQGLTEIVQRELGASRQGVVIALHVDGDLQFFEAYGERGSTPEELLTTDALFAYPAMSEVLLSLMVEALDSAEIVDGDAPLYTYLPDLSPLLGQATLRQLISHSGGLDDAQRVEGETWERTLDRIDDRALVAEPGLFYSRSRHSFPLAARALTAALRRPFDELAATLILEPLGMTSSTFDVDEARIWGLVAGLERNDDATSPTRSVEAVDTLTGLPVLFTTAGDVVTLLSAWNDGQLGGRLPHEIASAKNPALDTERAFGGGLWVDEYRGLTRAYRRSSQLGISTGFYLIPETTSTIFIWWRGTWGSGTARFVLDAVADAAGAPPRRRATLAQTDFEPPHPLPPADRWAGTYRNGELIFVLRESHGVLVLFDGSRELDLEARDGARVVARLPDGRIAVRLDLLEDDAGRRFLYFGGLAYRHGADELGG